MKVTSKERETLKTVLYRCTCKKNQYILKPYLSISLTVIPKHFLKKKNVVKTIEFVTISNRLLFYHDYLKRKSEIPTTFTNTLNPLFAFALNRMFNANSRLRAHI